MSFMQIRRATIEDEQALAGIRLRSILALAAPTMSQQEAGRWANGIAEDRVLRALREHEVWVAVEGTAIGWVEIDGDRVAALYVSPQVARRGVGTLLLQRAETTIRHAGHSVARLDASRNALGFYERRGYHRTGPDGPDGACPMSRDLTQAHDGTWAHRVED